jgi:hypothetical protein
VETYAKAALENKETPVPGQKAQPEAVSDCLLVVLKKRKLIFKAHLFTFWLVRAALQKMKKC